MTPRGLCDRCLRPSQEMSASSSRRLLGWLLFATAALYLYAAYGSVIIDDGDALYADVAREMLARHDWITPYANGVRMLDKPPLLYWLTAASYWVFGVGEFATRVPTALAVIGTSWLLYLLG